MTALGTGTTIVPSQGGGASGCDLMVADESCNLSSDAGVNDVGCECEQGRIHGYHKSRVGWQEQCRRRSLGHLGRSRMLKKLKNAEKVKRVRTDRPTDRHGGV